MIKDINNFNKKQKERVMRGKYLQLLYLNPNLPKEESIELKKEQDRSYKMFDFMKKLKIEMEKENVE
jgi:hypothetical protein